MTRQDRSSLPTRPDPGKLLGTTVEPSHARTVRPLVPALLCLLGFLAVYLIAVCTPFGQRAENSLIFENASAKPAWAYAWSGVAYGSSAMPPLDRTAMPTVFVGLVVIAAVTVVRRCWWHGLAAAGIVVATLGSKVLTRGLPRPDLVGARDSLLEASFPSGHTAIPAGLALGAVLVSCPRSRPYVTAAGMLWLTVTAAAVQATYQHRPSDVLGATLLACACYGLATRLLPPAGAPGVTRHPRALPAAALALSAAGALVAGARDDSVTQSLVFAASAFLCSVLFWFTTAQRPERIPRRAEG
ncbi:phosphatase PAP2 family protein [Streptomyces sp. NPDC021356]|uniref:phosphatase PAP2 family protein n=1 Tax=Streptomyces sp. NPDC021356 TaxID=3154900 RepID=UPI0033E1B7BE